MRAYMAGYQALSILRGGPNTQIRGTAEWVNACGVEAHLFDPWAPFQREDCDIFHLFAANIGTYHLAREIHALGIPIVVSPIVYSRHSSAFVRKILEGTRIIQKAGPGIWSDYALTADICGWAGQVVPNTRAEAALVSEGLGIPESKITVIPNGVDERFDTADPELFRKEFGLENFILNVGHIGHARKNVLTLIKALSGIDHPAVIIGRVIKGKYGEACVREAAKYKHIRLIQGLPNDSALLASAYAACDVFVLPSLFETPGIAALEAGLAGAKVVITPHGGTEEYFADMAKYVDPDSVDSIRQGIISALGAGKDSRLRDHIRKNFLWRNVGEQTAAVYRKVLEQS